MSLECVWLFIIGCLDLSKNNNVKWDQAALCLAWLGTFQLSPGSVGWVYTCRGVFYTPAIQDCGAGYECLLSCNSCLKHHPAVHDESYSMQLEGKPGFFWFGFALVTAIWAYFRKPETKTRTSEELDLIFAAKLLTRKFRRYRMAELRGEEK